MASLPVYDRTGKRSRHVRHRSRPSLRRASTSSCCTTSVVMYQANLRQGTRQHEEPRRSRWHDQEDVSPKGYGQRPCRFAAQRYSPWRRSHLRQAAARLVVPPAAQGRAAGHADGDGLEDCATTQVVRDRRPELRRAEDQGNGRDPQGRWAVAARACWWPPPAHDVNVYKSARNIDKVDGLAGWRSECLDGAAAAPACW